MKTSAPSVSILLPVYNGEKYLPEALASVAAQTYRDFELVVGDDGSTDRSAEILAAFSGAPVRQVSDHRRRGLFGNLNHLIAQSQGALIRILCQDDLLAPDCLHAETEFFAAHPAVGMSFCKSHAIDRRGERVASASLVDLPAELPPLLSLQHFFYHGCLPGNLSTVCFRREMAREHGGFDENFRVSADYELWARWAPYHPMGVIPQHLVSIRGHAGQLSASPSSQSHFLSENRKIRDRLIPQLPPAVQVLARRFERGRHDVLDFHTVIRLLTGGQINSAFRMARQFGGARFISAGWHWLWSVNNRRCRPKVPWVMP